MASRSRRREILLASSSRISTNWHDLTLSTSLLANGSVAGNSTSAVDVAVGAVALPVCDPVGKGGVSAVTVAARGTEETRFGGGSTPRETRVVTMVPS